MTNDKTNNLHSINKDKMHFIYTTKSKALETIMNKFRLF